MLFQSYLNKDSAVLSVSQLTLQVKNLLERDPILEDIWVRGEVSNLSFPASGHVYFTLKDENSALRCVIFRMNSGGVRSVLSVGSEVEVHGHITVYEKGGEYQLLGNLVRPVGQGNLFEEFLKLKAKLEKEGLFDPQKKRKLPKYPVTVGVVTSSTGAALQDIRNIITKRWPVCTILLSPAAVQGTEAARELRNALQNLLMEKPDVILIARGGGAYEDLWCFNDEELTREVAASPIPVVSGIGHETDFTLVDFAADYRAPTPSGAAEAAVPDIQEILINIDRFSERLENAAVNEIEFRRKETSALTKRLEIQAPLNHIQQEKQNLSQMKIRLEQAQNACIRLFRQNLSGLENRLSALGPEAVLRRGYAMVENDQGKILTSAGQVRENDLLWIQMTDGLVYSEAKKIERKK